MQNSIKTDKLTFDTEMSVAGLTKFANGILTQTYSTDSSHCGTTVYEVAMSSTLCGDTGLQRDLIFALLELVRDGYLRSDQYGVVQHLSAVYALTKYLGVRNTVHRSESELSNVVKSLTEIIRSYWSLNHELGIPDTVSSELLIPALRKRIQDSLQPNIFGDGMLSALQELTNDRVPHELEFSQVAGLVQALKTKLASTEYREEAGKYNHVMDVLYLIDPTFEVPGPSKTGGVGCSISATHAAISRFGEFGPSTHFGEESCNEAEYWIDRVQRNKGAALGYSVCTGMDTFEQLWTLIPLMESGFKMHVAESIHSKLGLRFGYQRGIGGGIDLPNDADDTAYYLRLRQMLIGGDISLDALDHFWNGSYFYTYGTENTGSETTNAHCLDVLNFSRPTNNAKLLEKRNRMVTNTRSWLTRQQDQRGYWTDKWHASPIYATTSVLQSFTNMSHYDDSFYDGLRWVVSSQRADGGWGLNGTTLEETGMVLKLFKSLDDSKLEAREREGVSISLAKLKSTLDWRNHPISGRLWMGKDLYEPRPVSLAYSLIAVSAIEGIFH